MGRPKKSGRVTPKKCQTRSSYLGTQSPHKFDSKINDQPVCSGCGEPQSGTWPDHGLDVETILQAKHQKHHKKGTMFT